MEALACQEIFNRAEGRTVQLIPDRQAVAFELSTLCQVRIGPEDAIYTLAQSFSQQGKFSAKDILHVASAVCGQADCFITCDDLLLRQAKKLDLSLSILNPVDYIQTETQ